MGAGDGRFVVRSAAAHPEWLVIGVDANAAGLYDGFRRAQRAKLSNALFVIAAAEALPQELAGLADEVRIHFPWGSLLTAVLRAERRVLSGLAGLLKPGGELTILVSVVERDGLEGFGVLDDRTAAGVGHRIVNVCDDLLLQECRVATGADLAASHSTWGKRLGVGRSRTAWLLRFHKISGERQGDGALHHLVDPHARWLPRIDAVDCPPS